MRTNFQNSPTWCELSYPDQSSPIKSKKMSLLEDAFQNEQTLPAEAASALSNFLIHELNPQSSDGSAEARLAKTWPKIMERIFGSVKTAVVTGSNNPEAVLEGGWMNRNMPPNWNALNGNSSRMIGGGNSPSRIQSSMHLQRPSIDKDVLVRLLLPTNPYQPTLLDAALLVEERLSGARFSFPLSSLPPTSQKFLVQMVPKPMQYQSDLGGPIYQQQQLQLQQESVSTAPRESAKKLYTSLHVPVIEQMGVLGSTSHQDMSQRSPGAPAAVETSDAFVLLSMFEHYLFYYFKFPAMRAHRNQPMNGQGKTYGETVYLSLFRCYVRNFVRHSNNSDVLSNRGELFLRVLIEMWLEGNNESYSESYMRQQNVGANDDSLENAFEKTQVCEQYNCTPSYTLEALKQLVSYLCTDEALKQSVFEASSYSAQWCLTPAMTVMQQPLFSFIRLALRYAPIHSRNASTFYCAFSMWLRLLEPWNSKYFQHIQYQFSFQTSVLQLIF